MNKTFSKRLGVQNPPTEITIRCDAPENFRGYLFELLLEYKIPLKKLLKIVCFTVKIASKNNWSEDFIKDEIRDDILYCKWFYVYDLIESVYQILDETQKIDFADEINEYFRVYGIGWKFENGLVEYRGDDILENDFKNVQKELSTRGLNSSRKEIEEAIQDLSKRPYADVTGAIQHSLTALECVCRKVSGAENMTLGALIKKYPDLVPNPLNTAIEKIWGFASEQGRHLKDGKEPKFEEAELLTHLSSSLIIYLLKKINNHK